MTRILFIFLTIFSSTLSMSQGPTFSQTLNKLFFGVDISNKSSSLVDSFLSIPQLHYHAPVARQWNLNVSMQMKSDKASSSKHEFAFTETPLPDYNIRKGIIEVNVGQADTVKKLLDLNWHLDFNCDADAIKYFERLKQVFSEVSTNKKFSHDKDEGDMAQFSTRKQSDTGIRDVTFFLYKSLQTKKFEIALLLGNEIMNE